MKDKIHPTYGACVIRCACGNVIQTRGTRPEIMVDVCSACHPFFTGKQKLLDTAGRIDKFAKKFSGKVVSSKKIRKSKTIVAFSPTLQKVPERQAPVRKGPGAKKSADAAPAPKK